VGMDRIGGILSRVGSLRTEFLQRCDDALARARMVVRVTVAAGVASCRALVQYCREEEFAAEAERRAEKGAAAGCGTCWFSPPSRFRNFEPSRNDT